MTAIYRDQEIWFDAYRLTSRTNTLALEYGVETLDDTTFGDTNRSMKAGLKTVASSVSGFYDASLNDSGLFTDIGVVDKPLTFADSSTEGVVAYFYKAMATQYTPLKNSVGELIGYDLVAGTTGDLVRGTLMVKQDALASTGTGTGRQLGTVSATQTLCAALHVISVAGTSTPTITVTVKSDNGAGFGSPATQITFDAATAVGSQYKTIAGAITDDYYRIDYAISGTNPVFGIVVALGIL